ncbi:MAG TPA: zf-HC2 domain-containing protein [Vicinamibacterales bacterium]
MNCSQYTEAIQELADGTLGPIRRAELQTHLDTCESCRALVADLQKIRDAAGSLGEIKPPDHTWLRIAAQLREEQHVSAKPLSRHRSLAGLALAASLVLVVGASLWLVRSYRIAETQPGNAAPSSTVQSIADNLTIAERHYQAAIDELEKAATTNDGSLDPEVAAVLERNLQVIDQAIAESKSALQAEPQSAPARESLFGALRQKVTLLQTTIALMNEMRKGNSAGAAQLVDSGSKS